MHVRTSELQCMITPMYGSDHRSYIGTPMYGYRGTLRWSPRVFLRLPRCRRIATNIRSHKITIKIQSIVITSSSISIFPVPYPKWEFPNACLAPRGKPGKIEKIWSGVSLRVFYPNEWKWRLLVGDFSRLNF